MTAATIPREYASAALGAGQDESSAQGVGAGGQRRGHGEMGDGMNQAGAKSMVSSRSAGVAPQGVELRHLRYFVAVADTGTFTHAAERMFIAQPTLSQQIRRLEEMVGTPLLQRRREGVRLTEAGTVLLEESRTVLSLIEHGVSRTRQAAGLGRPRLRFVVPPHLPEALAVQAASRLRTTAAAAGVEVAWMETRAGCGVLAGPPAPCRRRAGVADGGVNALPAPVEVMSLGDFEPDVWLPADHPAAPGRVIGLGELARMDVIHGPRRASAATYDAWLAVMQASNPRFDFADPPFRQFRPIILAFAATASRPTAVLTGPQHRLGDPSGPAQPDPADGPAGMVRARVGRMSLDRHGEPGVEWRPAARAPAGALRHRRQHRVLTCLPGLIGRRFLAGGQFAS